MAKQNINQDRDGGARGHLLQQMDSQKELDEVLQLEKAVIDTTGNPPAKSFMSTGRGCPKCKNRLQIKELNQDSGLMTIFCGTCGSEFHAPDVESTTAIGDAMHRQIPDELVLRYMTAREKELDKREKNGG